MFRAELIDAEVLKTSFNSISSIVNEVTIETDSEGMRLDALDSSHITFVHLELKKELFDMYECDIPEKISIDTGELNKILKRAKTDDTVILSVDEGNLVLTFKGDATKTFKIGLIDLHYDNPVPPVIEHPVKLELPLQILKDSVKDIGIFSKKISLKVNADYFIASADGQIGDVNIKYIHGENIDVEESVQSFFALDKVSEMLKADKFTDTAVIGLGDDMPLSLTMNMLSGAGVLSFLLAPTIEEVEEE